MDVNHPTVEEPATKEYVLSVFRYTHRQNLGDLVDDLDEIGELTFETTVSDWIDALDLDLMLAGEIGHVLNRWWEIDCPTAEWRRGLKPAREKRLRDVCELIATHCVRRRFRPANIFGRQCSEAGAFLTVRSLLADSGADVTSLIPSTPLRPYLESYGSVFFDSIARLNPDKLPPLVCKQPKCDAACWLMLVGWLACLVGWLASWPIGTAAGIVLAVVAYATCWIAARCLPPKSVEFGSLTTFRDLSVALAEEK